MPADKPEAVPDEIEGATGASGSAVAADKANGLPGSGDADAFDLSHGDALNLEEAAAIASASRVQLLIIAGAVNSGKTTLVASLFHLFQRSPFAGYLFAGSASLVGFDRRCFLARTALGRERMDTVRTRPGETRTFLHMRLRAKGLSSSATDLLFFDLSGEDYRRAKDSVEECRRMGVLRRADHFILLVDGEQLSDRNHRQKASNEPSMLLRCCLDAGQLDRHSYVDVLFTKWDLVEPSGKPTEHSDFVAHVEDDFKRRFESRLGRLRFFKVAARPATLNHYKLGYGIEAPFPSWVEERPQSYEPTAPILNRSALSEFDRYLLRRLPNHFGEASK